MMQQMHIDKNQPESAVETSSYEAKTKLPVMPLRPLIKCVK